MDPVMVKRVMWGILVAALMTAAGLLARRLSTSIWQSTTGEAPPDGSI